MWYKFTELVLNCNWSLDTVQSSIWTCSTLQLTCIVPGFESWKTFNDYAHVVRQVGKDIDWWYIGRFISILWAAAIMMVDTALLPHHTRNFLQKKVWWRVMEASKCIIACEDTKVFKNWHSRMTIITVNLTTMVGRHLTTKLIEFGGRHFYTRYDATLQSSTCRCKNGYNYKGFSIWITARHFWWHLWFPCHTKCSSHHFMTK